MIATKEDIAEIKGVHLEVASGPGPIGLDDAELWMENWLWEQESVALSESYVQILINDCEMTRPEAIRQAVVDHAFGDWLQSLGEDYLAKVGRLSVAPIV